jgi:hypothetical protein
MSQVMSRTVFQTPQIWRPVVPFYKIEIGKDLNTHIIYICTWDSESTVGTEMVCETFSRTEEPSKWR